MHDDFLKPSVVINNLSTISERIIFFVNSTCYSKDTIEKIKQNLINECFGHKCIIVISVTKPIIGPNDDTIILENQEINNTRCTIYVVPLKPHDDDCDVITSSPSQGL